MCQVDLCGHATLAAAHALWEAGELPRDAPARFHTRSGLLVARRLADGLIELDFPADSPTPVGGEAGEALSAQVAAALGGVSLVAGVWRSSVDVLVELSEAGDQAMRAVRPDMALLSRVAARGVIVTSAAGSSPPDFLSRFFAPASGIPEDPVTGSAHCALAPFWAARLGRSDLEGFQASARGGRVSVSLDAAAGRVRVRGPASTVLTGTLSAAAAPPP